MATLIGIARAAAEGAPMKTTDTAEITTANGIAGDARGTKRRRQVTVLARESWAAACDDLDAALPWTLRRANLLVEGVSLEETAGRRLRVGEAVLEVTMETAPCGIMEQQQDGLRQALTPDWRGGVCCRVIEDGAVRVGDEVVLE